MNAAAPVRNAVVVKRISDKTTELAKVVNGWWHAGWCLVANYPVIPNEYPFPWCTCMWSKGVRSDV